MIAHLCLYLRIARETIMKKVRTKKRTMGTMKRGLDATDFDLGCTDVLDVDLRIKSLESFSKSKYLL